MAKRRLIFRKLLARLKGSEGFSLVEVLVASTIMVIFMLGLGGMFVYTNKSFATARNQTTAVNIVKNRFALLKSTALSNITSGTVTYKQTDSNNITYRWTVTVTPLSGIDAKKVAVMINWTSVGRKTKNNSFTMATITTGMPVN